MHFPRIKALFNRFPLVTSSSFEKKTKNEYECFASCAKPLIFCRRRQTVSIFLLAALEDYIDETRSNGFALTERERETKSVQSVRYRLRLRVNCETSDKGKPPRFFGN